MKPYISIIFLLFNCLWAEAQNNSVELNVRAACGMCSDRIESAAMQIRGVENVSYNLNQQVLTVKVTSDFILSDLAAHLAAVGHDNELFLATDEVYTSLHFCCRYRDLDNESSPVDHLVIKKYLDVRGICGMCEDRIQTEALKVLGVESASFSLGDQRLTVSVDLELFNIQNLANHLAFVGHDNEYYLATDEQYEALHHCCKYRDMEVHDAEDSDAGDVTNLDSESLAALKEHYAGDGHSQEEHFDTEGLINGIVYGRSADHDNDLPLAGANVYWQGTTVGTSSDAEGHFTLPYSPESQNLVISYIVYGSDTIDMSSHDFVKVVLLDGQDLDEIVVSHKSRSTEISFISPIKVHRIGEEELLKAACCNLSESFETTPSVDVSQTDAITGTRKIEMLGLAGPYVQIGRENMPYIRGLSGLHGLEHIPGAWVQGMQLNMGAGSVVNGPESITGQINVEIKKPNGKERRHINLYANAASRLELNYIENINLSPKWSTGILTHAKRTSREFDNNNDDFMDMPLSNNLIIHNRYKFVGDKGLMGQFGFKGTYIDQTSGQLSSLDPSNLENLWRAQQETKRIEAYGKMGIVNPKKPYQSVGIQFSTSFHDQNFDFNKRAYDAVQKSLYANAIFQTIIGSTDKVLKVGASFSYDDYDEQVEGVEYIRTEQVPGVFTEYTMMMGDQWTLVGGLRADYHSIFGLFFTPRLHIRYAPDDRTALRLAGGRGQRTSMIFSDNIGLFASNRSVQVRPSTMGSPYGLNPEVAYNIGLNATREFKLNNRSLVFGVDYYYTWFDEQVVVDWDQSPQEINFYNLDGSSTSHSVQIQSDWSISDRIDVRTAYRYNRVETDFLQGRLVKPLTPEHRAFINLAVDFGKGWSWDGTISWQGTSRLPITRSNPEEFRALENAPDIAIGMTQLTKAMDNGMAFYLGSENLFNYRQQNAILSSTDPNSEFFDASLIYAPIFGRNIYAGWRWSFR